MRILVLVAIVVMAAVLWVPRGKTEARIPRERVERAESAPVVDRPDVAAKAPSSFGADKLKRVLLGDPEARRRAARDATAESLCRAALEGLDFALELAFLKGPEGFREVADLIAARATDETLARLASPLVASGSRGAIARIEGLLSGSAFAAAAANALLLSAQETGPFERALGWSLSSGRLREDGEFRDDFLSNLGTRLEGTPKQVEPIVRVLVAVRPALVGVAHELELLAALQGGDGERRQLGDLYTILAAASSESDAPVLQDALEKGEHGDLVARALVRWRPDGFDMLRAAVEREDTKTSAKLRLLRGAAAVTNAIQVMRWFETARSLVRQQGDPALRKVVSAQVLGVDGFPDRLEGTWSAARTRFVDALLREETDPFVRGSLADWKRADSEGK